ncbi:MAG: hypothetical protein AUJ85_02795 [Elusimicrobia bacterium CG1_02_37_114]|nr:MAG: hypothetical protein AUJ85_02795 [Elusimicrobia bacterium CG1_02_37_114]PIV53567.1 MAG: hypothetical protein COS17_03270 [Elusimicrobia bacterium CG02_land_8_20_14_3_00_37_13]PIZ13731.1 MAG: hypothetical protein COY53_03305 [Elusimicrobia bacterium CG_4_10_14_0_8_um_filter_37_32]
MRYKIFVSGVQKELKEERRAIKYFIQANYLLSEYFDIFLFEDLPAKSESSKEVYIDEINDSDIYMGILGGEYGTIGKDGLSATEREYRQAKKKSKTIFAFIKNVPTKDKKIESLIATIKTGFK